MKHALTFSLFLLAALSVTAQTLTITPTSVEVVSAGAKTRAFYAIDDVFLTNTSTGGVTVKDASSGTVLFDGDTSEVTITGVTLWSAKAAKLKIWYNQAPYDGGSYPIAFLPKRGVNYLYKSATTKVSVIHARTKYTVWTGDISVLGDGETTSNMLSWIRNRLFMSGLRAGEELSDAATIAAGAAAGSSPTVTVTGRGNRGVIDLTTGTSATTTGVLCTVTVPVGYDNMFITLSPANATSAVQVARVFVARTSDTTFTLNASGTALSDATAYKWFYSIGGYNDTPTD